MLAYYPERSSPLLVKIGSRGITGAALLHGMYAATEQTLRCRMDGGSVRHFELRAVSSRKWRRVRPYDGMSVLLTDLYNPLINLSVASHTTAASILS